jgi:hypothetical protein
MKKLPAKILSAAALMFVLFAAPGFGEEILVESFGYYLDIPEDWELVDASNPSIISFASADKQAVFQVIVFSETAFGSAEAIASFYKLKIEARGDEAPFVYQGQNAVIADYIFKPGNYTARGWFFFFSKDGRNFALSAFCEQSRFNALCDTLLSCIDSFAPGEESRLYPGPVSQFYQKFPPERNASIKLRFGGAGFSLPCAEDETEANAVVIEREARILETADAEIRYAAWQRYYRIIFRDSYMRLLPVTLKLKPLLDKTAKETGAPAALLSWFQDFAYSRPDNFSGFQPPLDCIFTAKGDCDSLGMAYIIILRQLGFDAILLVSEKYSHALAAVDIPGEGARFDFEGKRYLVAEMTAKTAIGFINKNMTNLSFWLPVALGHPVKE